MSVAICSHNMKPGHARTSLLRPTSSAFIALLAVVFTAGTVWAAEPPQKEPNEWVGLELSPFFLGQSTGSADRGPSEGKRVTVLQTGASGVLRFARQNRPRYYWTPLELGFGRFEGDDVSIVGMAATEAGFRFRFSGGGSVEVGSALGVGGIGVDYANLCDGGCYFGGEGLIASS